MRTIILHGKEFISKEKFHEILKNDLKLPQYYGGNLDALWDCLATDIPLPLRIEWIDFSYSEKMLGEYAHMALEIFQKAEEKAIGKLIVEVKE